MAKECGVQYANGTFMGNGKVGVWDGKSVSKFDYLHVADGMKLLMQISKFKKHLKRNYRIRGEDGTFGTIPEFLKISQMNDWTEKSMKDICKTSGISSSYANDVLNPIVRVIYDQNINVSGFAGIVSVLPSVTAAYSVNNGNSELVSALFKRSGAHVHLNTIISIIEYDANEKKYTFRNQNKQEVWKGDVVVLAAPIEFLNLTFKNVNIDEGLSEKHFRDYVHWFVTHVQADGLSPAYFNTQKDEVPDVIMTYENSTSPFNVISIIDSAVNSNQKIYKIFSNVDVSDRLDSMFINHSDSLVQHWNYTFPDLQPPRHYQPLKAANNLYYVNTMESVVTAMEGSAISGRNVAKLISQEVC